MGTVERWRCHNPMSDPGVGPLSFDGLPADIGVLCRIVQGVLLHSDWIPAYGASEAQFRTVSRETLPLAARLRQIGEADPRPLALERATDKRAVGTCRDYALMLCGMLRHQSVPARVRCGFAAYFRKDWEDHWICEYWQDGRWKKADAQLDKIIAPRLDIDFGPVDLPVDKFITAGEAWRRCRSGEADPAVFGHGEAASGLWFVRVNVVRDHHSLNGRETSDWDTWRQATAADRVLSEAECVQADGIAAHPEAPIEAALTPPWLRT
ncbi:MAG: transglutaminase domain-containing protein [Reyranella sp.]|nr:transglutaminase domain-containing protein [Reyranella sp.]